MGKLLMPKGFKSIKEVFDTEPGLKKIRNVIDENDVINDFEKIFPEFIIVVRAKKVEKKTITLRVENAVWRNELKFKEKEIIEKINSFYNEERIKEIRFSAK